MAGLNFLHAVAQAWEAGKLFHIDLNDQVPGRYDQDFRFGSANVKSAFFLVKFLEDVGYDGPRHFDAHAYRTEDYDGVKDFARGCMRTYLILKEHAARWNADPEIQALVAEFGTRGQRGLGYERLDQLTMELLLGVRRRESDDVDVAQPLALRSRWLIVRACDRVSRRARRRRSTSCSSTARAVGRITTGAMTTRVLKKELDETGLFAVDVVTAPAAGADFSAFRPDFSTYQAIVLNYDAPDDRWPADLKLAFERYVTNGGGLVVVHAADNAFPDWKRLQRHDRRRRLARSHREGRTVLVLQRRRADVRHHARKSREPRTAPAVQGHRSRRESSDHERAARRLDASGRRAVCGAARARHGT